MTQSIGERSTGDSENNAVVAAGNGAEKGGTLLPNCPTSALKS